MAKAKSKVRSGKTGTEGVPKAVARRAATKAPEGYEKHGTSDIVGFWNPERVDADGAVFPLHFIPLEVKAFDSKLEKHKPSILIIGKLVEACTLNAPGGEDEIIEGEAGDTVGVWYKPGMSDIKHMGGVKVWMVLTGELETGKPNPMKTFDVLSTVKGNELHVSQDLRKESKHVETGFPGAGARGNAKANAQVPPTQGEDDIPF
jgi:hypothetical protein